MCTFKLSFSLGISYFYFVHEKGKGCLVYSRGRPGKDRNCVPFPSSLDLKEKIQDLRNDFLFHNETKMMILLLTATNNMISMCQSILKFGSWIVQWVSGCMQMHVQQFGNIQIG